MEKDTFALKSVIPPLRLLQDSGNSACKANFIGWYGDGLWYMWNVISFVQTGTKQDLWLAR